MLDVLSRKYRNEFKLRPEKTRIFQAYVIFLSYSIQKDVL